MQHHQHNYSIYISRVDRCTANVGLTNSRPNYIPHRLTVSVSILLFSFFMAWMIQLVREGGYK